MPWVHPNSTPLLTINVARGTLIELVFVILFLIYSDKKKRVKVAPVVVGEVIIWSSLFYTPPSAALWWSESSVVYFAP
ncbi:hypothetical protein SLA2020_194710 [Shorea laevis]